jgi:catechol 2,3-dioxygenase-like lactoylglutathione lyase family enzyme
MIPRRLPSSHGNLDALTSQQLRTPLDAAVLGLDADENGLWRQEAGLTAFATFESETDYFGSRAQQAMVNFRVRDLDAMLAQLRAKGADVAKETQDMEGVGRFGWVTDPEGNRVELWQPA